MISHFSFLISHFSFKVISYKEPYHIHKVQKSWVTHDNNRNGDNHNLWNVDIQDVEDETRIFDHLAEEILEGTITNGFPCLRVR